MGDNKISKGIFGNAVQLAVILLFTISMLIYPPESVFADKEINVFLNGKKVEYDVPAQVVDSRTLVPIRKTFEKMGAKVKWDSKDKSISIQKFRTKLMLVVGKKTIEKNGRKLTLDVPATVIGERTLVPLRFVADSLGYTVKWNSSTRSVIISTAEEVVYPQEEIPVTVLMYHHFQEDTITNAIVDPDLFKEQMSYLKENGYTTISDQDYISYLEGKTELPQKPLLITMDDGYESNYIYAYPILKELGMKATIYTIVSRIEDGNTYEFPRMTWAQAKEMYDSGVMEIQGHTYNMHHKDKTATYQRGVITAPIYIDGRLETQEEYERRALDDLLLSKQIIEEKVGNKVVSFTYPFGDNSDSAEELLKKAGFKLTFTIKPGMNYKQNGGYRLNRINVPGHFTGEDLLNEIEKYRP